MPGGKAALERTLGFKSSRINVKAASYGSPAKRWEPEERLEGRHLLRAILREATYLPDVQARAYIHSHALSRFRDYDVRFTKNPTNVERRIAKIKEATKKLKELKRANQGHRKMLLKVLHLTYGRIGKRRHELMRPLLIATDKAAADGTVDDLDRTTPDSSVLIRPDNDTSSSNNKDETTMHDKTSELPKLTTQLRALLQSQVRNSPPEDVRSNPKTQGHLNPRIPELNSWMKPMPQKRIANATKKWYADILDRTLPPLPTQEWEHLRDLAIGKLRFEGRVNRRARLQTALQSGDVHHETTSTINHVTDWNSGEAATSSDREITRRFMQRCWAVVFAQCPDMSWDSQANRWNIRWGSSILKAKRRTDLLIEDDVDANLQPESMKLGGESLSDTKTSDNSQKQDAEGSPIALDAHSKLPRRSCQAVIPTSVITSQKADRSVASSQSFAKKQIIHGLLPLDKEINIGHQKSH